ncbi:MAG: hypothetical protein IJS36_04590 [Kiritimatiellae bacterium]|nr:hypothetical protein [Kiritimatiellia bacterium]
MKRLMLTALFSVGLVAGIEAAPEDAVTQADLQAIFERLSRLEAENKAQADRIAELEGRNRDLVAEQAASKKDLSEAKAAGRQELESVRQSYMAQLDAVKAEYARDFAALQESSKRELAAIQASNKKDLAATEESFRKDLASVTALKTDEKTEKSESGRIFTTESGRKYYLADTSARIFEPLSESGLSITPYGYLTFEAVHNTHKTDWDIYTDWVRPRKNGGHNGDHQTVFSMNDSILGFNFDAPELYNGWKFRGKFEFDLAGDNANDPNFHFRHLYFAMNHEETGWDVLFGQTWHLWKMVTPNEIDGAWLEQTGHPYRRSPQIRVTKRWDWEDSSLEIRAGLVKNGNGMGGDRDKDDNEDNSASGWALLEGAVVYDRKAAWEEGDRRWLVGVGGMYGRDKSRRWTGGFDGDGDRVCGGDSDEYNTQMIMVAGSLPFLDKFTLTGQLFAGENLSGVQAGIGQGVAWTYPNRKGREVSTMGGFVDLRYDLNDKWAFAVGYGFDDPTDSEARDAEGRTYNDRAYIDAFYQFNDNLHFGLEYAHLRTSYYDDGDANSDRFQFTAFYDF